MIAVVGLIYGEDTKRAAMKLWLLGDQTDAQIAETLKIARVHTISDWAKAGDWASIKTAVDQSVQSRMLRAKRSAVAALAERHDRLAEAIEATIARGIRFQASRPESDINAQDVRSLAAALKDTQVTRRKAIGADRIEEAEAKKSPLSEPLIVTVRLAERPGAAEKPSPE